MNNGFKNLNENKTNDSKITNGINKVHIIIGIIAAIIAIIVSIISIGGIK